MTQILTTETVKLWRSNAEITAGETAEHDPEHIAAKAILALTAELLTNREAQPVFFIEIEGDDWINAGRIESKNRPDLGLLPDGINYLYAAPPAPAVVKLPAEFSSSEGVMVQLEKVMASLAVVGVEYERKDSACRAAMLAQPVSQGYKSQASINTNDERAMRLPAAPEGGN